MTETVKERLALLRSGEYKENRIYAPIDITKYEGLDKIECRAVFFADMAALESPCFIGNDPFGFNHSHVIRPLSLPFEISGNLTVDYEGFLESGFAGMRKRIAESRLTADEKGREFLNTVSSMLDEAEAIAQRYRTAAIETGNVRLADALSRIPASGAKNYYEALVGLKFLSFILRLNWSSHVTLGRFDKYMKPYFDASKKEGATDEELLELTELFFISMNFDTDFYAGVQQGDNGQSLVLGGCDADGEEVWSELSDICLSASEELCLIDPKINVRVNSKTPIEFYERCTRLTRLGLGFPQYSNDDVVIPGLVKLGYEERDARDYSVAACWEFIIPRFGGDIPNAADVDFPGRVEIATNDHLKECESFEEFKAAVKRQIDLRCQGEIERLWNFKPYPDPLLSAFILPCIERGRSFFDGGAKYRNFGEHGSGLSTAADALTAIELGVFGEGIKKDELLCALRSNFVGHEALKARLLSYPKLGCGDDVSRKNAEFLLNCFSEALQGKDNGSGGIWRAGSGSALNYVYHANMVGATADGRCNGEYYGANFSPSLQAKISSPTSVVRTFSSFDMEKVINGGPLTLEIHNSSFQTAENEKKIAALVKTFIDLGGHQLQLNSVSRETLLDAKRNPDGHKSLIVRVWGWSGYFVELDEAYQNHVIARTEFTV